MMNNFKQRAISLLFLVSTFFISCIKPMQDESKGYAAVLKVDGLDRELHIRDIDTGKSIKKIADFFGDVKAVAFNKRNPYEVMYIRDEDQKKFSKLVIVNWKNGEERVIDLPEAGDYRSVTFHPTKKNIIAYSFAGDSKSCVVVYDINKRKELCSWSTKDLYEVDHVMYGAIVFDPYDPSRLFVTYYLDEKRVESFMVLDWEKKKDVRFFKEYFHVAGDFSMCPSIAMAYSPEENTSTIALGADTKKLTLLGIENDKIFEAGGMHIEGDPDSIFSLEFDPDDVYLLYVGGLGKIFLWDWDKGRITTYTEFEDQKTKVMAIAVLSGTKREVKRDMQERKEFLQKLRYKKKIKFGDLREDKTIEVPGLFLDMEHQD